MATSERDLIGLQAFSKDGAKLGKIKDVIKAHGSTYLVIGRVFQKDLIVPAAGSHHTEHRVEVNFKNIYLDHAPEHPKGEPGTDEIARIDEYYRRAA